MSMLALMYLNPKMKRTSNMNRRRESKCGHKDFKTNL